jgi:hypothetical protein
MRPIWLQDAWDAAKSPRPQPETILEPKVSRTSNIWRSVTTRSHPYPEKNSPSTINIELRDIENQNQTTPTQANEDNPADPPSNSSDSTVVHHSTLMTPVSYLWPCLVARYRRLEAWAHASTNPLAYLLVIPFFLLWLLFFPLTNILWPLVRPLFRLIFFDIFGLFIAELVYAVMTFYQRITMIPWGEHLIPREHELTNIDRYWLGGWKRQVSYILGAIACVVVAVTFLRWFFLAGFLCPWLCFGPRGNGVDEPVYRLPDRPVYTPRTSTTRDASPTPKTDISTAWFASPTAKTDVSTAGFASPTTWTWKPFSELPELPSTFRRSWSTLPGGYVVVPDGYPYGPGGRPSYSFTRGILWTPDIVFTNTDRPTYTPDVVFTNTATRPTYTPDTIWDGILR